MVQIIPQDVGHAARFASGFLPRLGEGFAQGAQQGMGLQQQIAANIEQQRQQYQLQRDVGQQTSDRLLKIASAMDPADPRRSYMENLANTYAAVSGDPSGQGLLNTMLPMMQNQAQAQAMGLDVPGMGAPNQQMTPGIPPNVQPMPQFQTGAPNVSPLDPNVSMPQPAPPMQPATPEQQNIGSQPSVNNALPYSQIPQGEELTEGGVPQSSIPQIQKATPGQILQPSNLDRIAATWGPQAARDWLNYSQDKASIPVKQAELDNQMLKAEMEKKGTILADPPLAKFLDESSPEAFRYAENYIAANDNKSHDTIQNELLDKFRAFEKANTNTENYLSKSPALETGELQPHEVDAIREINKPLLDAGLYDDVEGNLMSQGINRFDSQLVLDPPSDRLMNKIDDAPDYPKKFEQKLRKVEKNGGDVNKLMQDWNNMKEEKMLPIAKHIFKEAGGKTNPLSVRALLRNKGYPQDVITKAWESVSDEIDYIPFYNSLGKAYMSRSDVNVNTENDLMTGGWKQLQSFWSQWTKRLEGRK